MEEEKQEKQEQKEQEWCKITTQKIEEQIKNLNEEGIQPNNIKYLSELVDVHKDLANEIYWKEKIDMYRESGNYGNYGEYSEGGSYGRRGVPGSGRGRYNEGSYNEGGYSEGGSYGRRGVKGTGRGRYRGEEMMDEMMYHYGNYSEGREQYGADQETMKSFKYMLKSFKDYYKHLKQEASSQQEVKMLEDVAREISEM